ncbi:neutral zinc metallopeptidase [Mucilaginibacter sp. 22184]|uniref:neutral zinc metallopeptidase n=1 Tax=Mucilaginibacter sp. 22184 TaxID=3453887 RepID=UPI003F859C4E
MRFLTGVWAHLEQSLKNVLDPGDIEEPFNAANPIGYEPAEKTSHGQHRIHLKRFPSSCVICLH